MWWHQRIWNRNLWNFYMSLSITARSNWPLYSTLVRKYYKVGECVSGACSICHQHNAGKTINRKFGQEHIKDSWSFWRLPNGFHTLACNAFKYVINTYIFSLWVESFPFCKFLVLTKWNIYWFYVGNFNLTINWQVYTLKSITKTWNLLRNFSIYNFTNLTNKYSNNNKTVDT